MTALAKICLISSELVDQYGSLPRKFMALGSAPLAKSRLTTGARLALAAQCRGVSLNSFLALTSAPGDR